MIDVSTTKRCAQASMAALLTSRQADGAAGVALDEVLGADVDVLLAQPPQAKVGRLARLIDLVHPWAQYRPVVGHHRGKHARHAHHEHEDGHLDFGALVHGSRLVWTALSSAPPSPSGNKGRR